MRLSVFVKFIQASLYTLKWPRIITLEEACSLLSDEEWSKQNCLKILKRVVVASRQTSDQIRIHRNVTWNWRVVHITGTLLIWFF